MDKLLSPIHPGEVLLEDFMKSLGLSQYRLVKDIGVAPIRISQRFPLPFPATAAHGG
jgi:plasmid maintenance system antidote protein VapI